MKTASPKRISRKRGRLIMPRPTARGWIPADAKQLIAAHGIPVASGAVRHDTRGSRARAEEMGGSVVLKIKSSVHTA